MLSCMLWTGVLSINPAPIPAPHFACAQDLLSGQFNVTLGDKLAEHLKKWIDVANVLQPPQPVSDWSMAVQHEPSRFGEFDCSPTDTPLPTIR